MKNQKGISSIVIILIIVGVLVAAVGVWYYLTQTTPIGHGLPSTITVSLPNGGEVWEIGKTYEIRWYQGRNPDDNVKIFLQDTRHDLFSESPLGEAPITLSTKNSGIYSWTVPEKLVDGLGRTMSLGAGNIYKIVVFIDRIGGECKRERCDESDNYFSIVSQDETLDWKTYRNEEYGFEVKYPDNWIEKDGFSIDGGFFYVNFVPVIGIISQPLIVLNIYPNQTTLEKFLKYFDYIKGERTDRLIDNAPAKEITYSTQDFKKSILVAFTKEGYGYEFGTSGYSEGEKTVNIVNQILSTFKFIDTGESDDLGACNVDSDCACGRKIGTNECFFGNKKYVNTISPCPDFCSGIDGKMRIKCVNNICTSVR